MGLRTLPYIFGLLLSIFVLNTNVYSDFNLEEDKLRQIFYIEDDIAKLNDLIDLNDTKIRLYKNEIAKIKNELKLLEEFISFAEDTVTFSLEKYEAELEDINKFKENIEKLKVGYKERLIWLYKNGSIIEQELLFASSNFNEFYSRLKYLNKISNLRKRNLERILKNEYILNEKTRMQKLRISERETYLSQRQDDRRILLEKLFSLESEMRQTEELNGEYLSIISSKQSEIASINKRIQFIKEPFVYKINQVVDYPDTNFQYLKSRLILPVQSVDIITDFGTYINSETFTISQSNGITVSISKNSEVKVVASGVVEDILFIHEIGDVIIINHGDGFRTVYGSTRPLNIVKGMRLRAGDIIGWTQNSRSGQAFHFELWRDKEPLDPKFWFRRN